MAVDNDTAINADALYRVKNAVFEYYADSVQIDPRTGEQTSVKAPRFAFRRQVLEGLSDEDARRGLNRGEIVEVRRKEEDATEETEAPGIVGSNAEEIAAWIKSSRPSVMKLVEQTGDDAELASMVLEAEDIATDGSPRATLVTALTKVIEAGPEGETADEEEDEEEEELDEEEDDE